MRVVVEGCSEAFFIAWKLGPRSSIVWEDGANSTVVVAIYLCWVFWLG